jgi:hypothetical protein
MQIPAIVEQTLAKSLLRGETWGFRANGNFMSFSFSGGYFNFRRYNKSKGYYN